MFLRHTIIGTLVVITLLSVAGLVLAEGGEFIIDIGEDIIIPDEDFGMGKEDSQTSRGFFSGEIRYSFKYTDQREDSVLTDLGGTEQLFTLCEKEHSFLVKLNYTYNMLDDSRLFFQLDLLEKKQEGTEMSFDIGLKEAFISHGFGQAGNLILGKQKLNFGNGFGWTPTGIFGTSQLQNGVLSGRWSIPYKDFNFTTVVIPPMADRTLTKGQLYQRVEVTYGAVNTALSGYVYEEGQPGFGIDFSTFLGDVEIYSGISARMENKRLYLTENTTPLPLEDIITYQFEKRDTEDFYLQGLIGVSYTWPGTQTYLMAEYYHDSTGLTANEIEKLAKAALYCSEKYQDPNYDFMKQAFLGQLGEINNYFKPGKMGRDYLFLGMQDLKIIDNLSVNFFGSLNTSHWSAVVNPEVKYVLNDHTSLILGGSFFIGDEYTEYGMAVIDREITIKTVSLF